MMTGVAEGMGIPGHWGSSGSQKGPERGEIGMILFADEDACIIVQVEVSQGVAQDQGLFLVAEPYAGSIRGGGFLEPRFRKGEKEIGRASCRERVCYVV
mgnify:CR=1 FL=1